MKVEFQIANDEVTLLFKKIKARTPFTEAEANEVAVFLKAHYKQIIDKWQTVFILAKSVTCETVRRKIKKPKKK